MRCRVESWMSLREVEIGCGREESRNTCGDRGGGERELYSGMGEDWRRERHRRWRVAEPRLSSPAPPQTSVRPTYFPLTERRSGLHATCVLALVQSSAVEKERGFRQRDVTRPSLSPHSQYPSCSRSRTTSLPSLVFEQPLQALLCYLVQIKGLRRSASAIDVADTGVEAAGCIHAQIPTRSQCNCTYALVGICRSFPCDFYRDAYRHQVQCAATWRCNDSERWWWRIKPC
ncbi:hypothetical protein GY45DRAFT_1005967 [Cubamyces sp. BRFM 1775]|nr:hypothetical protein GY45DRAFT_1005967 [Cubamyces sp. BRFM 1775]